MSYQRTITRTRQVGRFTYQDEEVQDVRGCRFETRRSGGRTWAVLKLARAFHQLAEFNWMDEYKVYYGEGDLRFVGYLTDLQRTVSTGEIELTLWSPVFHLHRIYPFFPTDESSHTTHPAEADIGYWVKALIDEWAIPKGQLSYDEADIHSTGIIVERPILESRYSLATLLDLWALMAGYWSWGVDMEGEFYFQPVETTTQGKFHIGPDRGWGKVQRLSDHFSLDRVVNVLRIQGDSAACVDDQGRLRYPAASSRFKREYEDSFSVDLYGKKVDCLCAPSVRSEKQASALAEAVLKGCSVPSHRFRLNASNVVQDIQPRTGSLGIYDEAGSKIGHFPVERVLYSFEEDVRAEILLGICAPTQLFSSEFEDYIETAEPSDVCPPCASNDRFEDSYESRYPNLKTATVTEDNGDGTYNLVEEGNTGNAFSSVSIGGDLCARLSVGDRVLLEVPTRQGLASSAEIKLLTGPIPLDCRVTDGENSKSLTEVLQFDNQGNLCLKESTRIILGDGSSIPLSTYIGE